MIETGNLSDFNQANCRDISACNDADIVAILSKESKRFPNIYLLLTETTKFYTSFFPDLQKCIRREKRLVVFETPSRVSMTHEYTIEGMGNQSQGFHFLFNTRERLSWLKVFIEDKRVSIASRAKVVSLLTKKLGTELEEFAKYLHISPNDTALRLYEVSDGKPCFVEFNQKDYKGQQSLLLSVTFFDSIRNKTSNYKKRWWSPLQEKKISYNYSTISGNANAWIYFKSPNNFVLSASHNAKAGLYEASPSNDDEITSLVLTPKGEKLSVDFTISINVPNALKVWYIAMLYLAFAGVICGWILLIYGMCTSIPEKMIETFNNCSFAIIAALIATRGWLMSEEQVMKKISNWYTIIIVLWVVLIMSLSFISYEKSVNTDVFHNSLPHKIVDSSIPENIESNYNHNNKGKVEDALNNKTKIKAEVHDSLSKNPCEYKTSTPIKNKEIK